MSDSNHQNNSGIQRLVEMYKEEFKQPENTEYYSEKDYAEAEKRYVSFRLTYG